MVGVDFPLLYMEEEEVVGVDFLLLYMEEEAEVVAVMVAKLSYHFLLFHADCYICFSCFLISTFHGARCLCYKLK